MGISGIGTKYREYTILILGVSIAYFIHILARPVVEGRDFNTYFLYFRDLFSENPEYPVIMLFRTPVTSLVFGGLFQSGSSILLGLHFYLGFIGILSIIYTLVRPWGLTTAYSIIAVICISSEFVTFYRSVASENVTAIAIIVWFFLAYQIRNRKSFTLWMLLGLMTVFMVLVRPNHIVLSVIALLALFIPQVSWHIRIRNAAVLLVTIIIGINLYSAYNWVRYDKYEVAHLGPAHMPFYRLFIHEKMIRPDSGPASAELHRIVTQDILQRDVFMEYQIDSELFYRAATPRFWIHLVDALNQEYGYLDNNSLLRKVSIEAIRVYPEVFVLSYIESLREIFEYPRRLSLRPRSQVHTDYQRLKSERYTYYQEIGLDVPDEDDLIPGVLSQLTFQPERYKAEPGTWAKPWQLNVREGQYTLQRITYLAGYLRPSVYLLLVFAVLGLLNARMRYDYIRLLVITGVITSMLAATAMANPEPQFRFPFDPILIMVGILGLSNVIKLGQLKIDKHTA